jgi:hypothetical protein
MIRCFGLLVSFGARSVTKRLSAFAIASMATSRATALVACRGEGQPRDLCVATEGRGCTHRGGSPIPGGSPRVPRPMPVPADPRARAAPTQAGARWSGA